MYTHVGTPTRPRPRAHPSRPPRPPCRRHRPQVNYREGISRAAEVRYVHKKQSGGSGQFADVAIKFEPGEPGTGFEFRSEIKGGVVPKEYIPGVTKVGPVHMVFSFCCWFMGSGRQRHGRSGCGPRAAAAAALCLIGGGALATWPRGRAAAWPPLPFPSHPPTPPPWPIAPLCRRRRAIPLPSPSPHFPPPPPACLVQGLEEMMSSGSLAGFPVVDVRTTLYDGSYHDVDSSVLAFQIAARAAFREGMKKAGVQLLEPIMKVGGWWWWWWWWGVLVVGWADAWWWWCDLSGSGRDGVAGPRGGEGGEGAVRWQGAARGCLAGAARGRRPRPRLCGALRLQAAVGGPPPASPPLPPYPLPGHASAKPAF